MFTDSAFRLTNDEPIFEFYKIGVMEYVFGFPKSNESWIRLLIDSVKQWWMKKQVKKFEKNYFLID